MSVPARVLLPTLLLAGCASLDPALQARIDHTLLEYATVKPRSVPASPAVAVMPWQRGQFVLLAITSAGVTSLIKLAVTAQDTQQVALSFTLLSPRLRNESDLVFKAQPRTMAEAEQFLQLLIAYRGNDPPITYRFEGDAPSTRLMRDQLQRLWRPLLVQLGEGATNPEPVSTRAGTFEGCVSWAGHLKLRSGPDTDFAGWAHPGVPLVPVVKAVSPDGATTLELLDYGLEGGGPDL